jgi:hypothetical protein
MKTVTLSTYHPWGSSGYAFDLFYRNKLIKTFEGHEYDTLYKMAKAWALVQGFTHYRHSGTMGAL